MMLRNTRGVSLASLKCNPPHYVTMLAGLTLALVFGNFELGEGCYNPDLWGECCPAGNARRALRFSS